MAHFNMYLEFVVGCLEFKGTSLNILMKSNPIFYTRYDWIYFQRLKEYSKSEKKSSDC